MKRREFLKFAVSVTATTVLPQSVFGMAKPLKRRPNFVFILIDDMGWMDIGCYGSSLYETPNIDRLAAEGMRFTDAYAACPVCSPARASIMTGKYPARLNLTDWIPGLQAHYKKQGRPIPYKLISPEFHKQLPLEEVTIAEVLRKAGYATASIGKWHLGHEKYYPEHQGFDINIGGTDSGMATSFFYPKWKNNPPLKAEEGKYLTDLLTDKSVEFITENKDKPFLLYLSHYAVHVPIEAKKEYVNKYKAKIEGTPAPQAPRLINEDGRDFLRIQDNPAYAGMVQSVDQSVGRVMKTLDELGIADNTIIIFMSDNGGFSNERSKRSGPTSNVPLRAGKGWLYEGGIREPMIIKWPGEVKPGSICNEPVTSTDFYPTMLEMAGLSLRPNWHKDGKSLVSLLKQEGKFERKAIYWHYPHYSPQGSTPAGAVRMGNWKLIEFYEDNRIELYNLEEDISEKHNLAEKMPEKAQELRKMLHNWRKSVNARMPYTNPQYSLKSEE